MALLTIPHEVLDVIRNNNAGRRRRPKRRDTWSPAERRVEALLPAPRGRRVAVKGAQA